MLGFGLRLFEFAFAMPADPAEALVIEIVQFGHKRPAERATPLYVGVALSAVSIY
jgi:hypothetical protein